MKKKSIVHNQTDTRDVNMAVNKSIKNTKQKTMQPLTVVLRRVEVDDATNRLQ